MPKSVYSLQLIVNSLKKSVYRLPSTVYRKSKGFTLIELLIVISIIGILASLTLASYGGAQQKSRDAIRKSDLTQIKRAMELAKADCRNSASYPYLANFAALKTYLVPPNAYVSSVPDDPQSPAKSYVLYPSTSNADATTCPSSTPGMTGDYTLMATLERTTDQDGSASWTRCVGKPYTGAGSVGGLVPGGATYPANSGIYLVCNN